MKGKRRKALTPNREQDYAQHGLYRSLAVLDTCVYTAAIFTDCERLHKPFTLRLEARSVHNTLSMRATGRAVDGFCSLAVRTGFASLAKESFTLLHTIEGLQEQQSSLALARCCQ